MKKLITVACACGEEHQWWHDCLLPVPIDSDDTRVRT